MTLSQYLGRGVVSRGRMTITPGLDTNVYEHPYLHNDLSVHDSRGSYHWANIGGRLGEDTGPVGQVFALVALNRRRPGLVEVIKDYIGVGDDQRRMGWWL